MKRKISNYGDSVRARLLALARSENVQLEYLLLRYALERFGDFYHQSLRQKDLPIASGMLN